MATHPSSCPTCGQVIPPNGFYLPRIKRLIYDTVRRRPGISAAQLRDLVWCDDPDGGPLTDTKCLHVHVSQLNDRLAPHGITIRSQSGGYRIRRAT
jgi:hypothetical protein